jgi:predicted acylesterase/phospholipase RssA
MLSAFLRVSWLIFPGFLFLFAAWAIFWKLLQGHDVIQGMLEKRWIAGIVLLAVVFWAMVIWYTGRILIYRKDYSHADNLNEIKIISLHLPRLMGYLGFSIVWIALLRLPDDDYLYLQISNGACWALLGLSIVMYPFLVRLFKSLSKKILSVPGNVDQSALVMNKRYRTVYIISVLVLFTLIIINTFITSSWLFFISLIILQLLFLFDVIIRRGREDNAGIISVMPKDYASIAEWQEKVNPKKKNSDFGIWEHIAYRANLPWEEKRFFISFNIIALLSIIVYIITIFYYPFSVRLGSFATVLISFGVLIGFFSFISFASVATGVNFHVVAWIIVWIFGSIFEPHWATIKKNPYADFKHRPDLNTYFNKWLDKRHAEFDTTGNTPYPVFFVLADGGASRSGYWTAGVLGKLEDVEGSWFSHHLFCLSGASGGSVGNGTFLALLKYREELKKANQSFTKGAGDYLQSDFLTYTLARMLGPDFFRPIFPLPDIADRASALENAMDNGETSFLQGKMKTGISEMIPFEKDNDSLPIICINTTRMQDGTPSVISTLKLDENNFGRRIDILERLQPGEDLKLSTSVVMGARFPYLSPAGRIDSSYYVDGGYFDNSGAGIVNEMIIALNDYCRNPDSLKTRPWLKNLKFYIIHAQNGFSGGAVVTKVNSIVNDLAAPILTLAGSYGTQTSVNDWRLKKYMQGLYHGTDSGYHIVNLYSGGGYKEEFPMNWVISRYYINRMNQKLETNPQLLSLINWINSSFKK